MLYRILLLTILFFSNSIAEEPGTPVSEADRVIHYAKEHNNTGILLLVKKQGTVNYFAAGLADRERKKAMHTDDLFEIGSASKMFTAIAIFQLIEKGKLSLNTSLGKLYPKGKIRALANFKGRNYWDEVTVGMLLNHTTGFIDYLNVYGDDAKAIQIYSDKSKVYTFDTVIGLALHFGDANFKPGTAFKYCNTGYIILGDIISKVSGMDWHDYIEKHIFDKAGVKRTYFGTRLPKGIRKKMPKGYLMGKPVSMPMALAGSAGEIVSNLDDLARLIDTWREGGYYQKHKTLQIQMTQGYHRMDAKVSNMNYGYGLMEIDGYYGHGGQTFGFESYVTTNPDNNNTYIVGTNDAMVRSMNLFMQTAGIELKHVSDDKKP
jgi:D-alanyl-D-alanine carboxypeptidase